MRFLVFLLLLIPAPAQDERFLRWEAFARDCNEYNTTIEANPVKRQKHKERLNREWNAVYPLL